MAKRTRPPRRPVTVPLSPTVLHQIGGLKSLPPPDPKFDPYGTWTHVYRIWTCYGYNAGRTDGTLRLERKYERRPDRLVARWTPRLAVRQTIRNADGVVNVIEANMPLRSGGPIEFPTWDQQPIDYPASCTTKSTFTDTKGNPAPGLTDTGAMPWFLPYMTVDWCLFSTVQQLPLKERELLKVTVYEGGSLMKSDHRLWYHGAETVKLGERSHRLHVFHQIGEGILPYEYWVDESRRLQLVVTGPRAYILDPKGDAK